MELVAGATYRVRGTHRKVIFTGDLAATPPGKPQAYWFIDAKQQSNHAYTTGQVKPLKKGKT